MQIAGAPPGRPCNLRDESINLQGPGRCATDCDCDGMRSCVDGACSGEARPVGVEHCRDASCRWNEEWNGGGAGVCASDCQCNGSRVCAAGRCQDARPPQPGDNAFTK